MTFEMLIHHRGSILSNPGARFDKNKRFCVVCSFSFHVPFYWEFLRLSFLHSCVKQNNNQQKINISGPVNVKALLCDGAT